jgi:hypothetical protein
MLILGRDGKYNLEAGIKKLGIVSSYAKKPVSWPLLRKPGLNPFPILPGGPKYY